MIKSFTNLFFTSLFTLCLTLSYGQKDVYFQLNQFIGETSFTLGDSGTNDLGTKFNISRLDYYISLIKLHHDGGSTTVVTNKYIFVSKGRAVNELLGSYDINVLDSITFSVGVEAIDNHADPTLWPSDHPLAPKSPEMHWGWAAGYRFVAIEGKSGANLQFNYEIHALGDELYKPTTIITNGTDQNGALIIAIDADYQQSFKGINMNKNVFQHGSNKEAITLLANYNNEIFTPAEATSGISNVAIGELKTYPNPVVDGNLTISLTQDQTINATIVVRDVLGRIYNQISKPDLQNEVIIRQSGFYVVELLKAGKLTYRSSIVKL
jgi:hypothetical protein